MRGNWVHLLCKLGIDMLAHAAPLPGQLRGQMLLSTGRLRPSPDSKGQRGGSEIRCHWKAQWLRHNEDRISAQAWGKDLSLCVCLQQLIYLPAGFALFQLAADEFGESVLHSSRVAKHKGSGGSDEPLGTSTQPLLPSSNFCFH